MDEMNNLNSELSKKIVRRQTRKIYVPGYMMALILIILSFFRFEMMTAPFYFIIGLGVIIIIILELRILTKDKLFVSKDCLTFQSGVFNVHTKTILYHDITDMGIRQSFFGRILNYGSLYINTAGSTEKEIAFNNISNPSQIKDIITRIKQHLVHIKHTGKKHAHNNIK